MRNVYGKKAKRYLFRINLFGGFRRNNINVSLYLLFFYLISAKYLKIIFVL